MKRLLALALMIAASGASAIIASGASAPASGPVRIGRPVEPAAAGRPPLGRIELRLANPDGGPRLATLVFRWRSALCAESGSERSIRGYPVREGGGCVEGRPPPPLSFGLSGGPGVPTVVSGLAPPEVERITIEGPGGMFELPLSHSRAYAAAYSMHETGDVTVTAHLADGTTRFQTTSLLPGVHAPEGAADVPDAQGSPDWQAWAEERRAGARRGQTCAQVIQRLRRLADGGLTGGAFAPPICGDLASVPVVAHVMALRPGGRRGSFSPPPGAPRRTLLWGAASTEVEAVSVRSPDGERPLELAAAGRGFAAVFTPDTTRDQLTLVVRMRDGSVHEHRAPDRLGAAPLNPVPWRFIEPLSASVEGDRLRLHARLSRRVRAFRISFLGRPVTMRHGRGGAYSAVYDATHGKYRGRARQGRRVWVSYTVCAPHCTAFRYARLRIRAAGP